MCRLSELSFASPLVWTWTVFVYSPNITWKWRIFALLSSDGLRVFEWAAVLYKLASLLHHDPSTFRIAWSRTFWDTGREQNVYLVVKFQTWVREALDRVSYLHTQLKSGFFITCPLLCTRVSELFFASLNYTRRHTNVKPNKLNCLLLHLKNGMLLSLLIKATHSIWCCHYQDTAINCNVTNAFMSSYPNMPK